MVDGGKIAMTLSTTQKRSGGQTRLAPFRGVPLVPSHPDRIASSNGNAVHHPIESMGNEQGTRLVLAVNQSQRATFQKAMPTNCQCDALLWDGSVFAFICLAQIEKPGMGPAETNRSLSTVM